MKILVVDDEENICRLYKAEFEDEGYEVSCANNWHGAMEMFDRERPDLVILDIVMSYRNEGIHLLGKMKALRPKLPIILSSAYDYRDDFSVWASEAYVMKSSDLAELKDAIKKCANPR